MSRKLFGFLLTLLLLLITPSQLVAQESTPEATTQPTTNSVVNIILAFDSSGSMAASLGNELKIDAARRAMEQVIARLPSDSPNLNVGFRVFGHEGNNTEAQRPLSCQSTDLLVPPLGVNAEALRLQTTAWQPAGWTPITLALEASANDLMELKAYQDCLGISNARNVIIMVSDGEETCGGDPCAAAQAIAAANAETIIHIVGFGLTPDVASTLNCVPQNGGRYIGVQDGDALAAILTDLIGQEINTLGIEFEPINAPQIEVTKPGLRPIQVTPFRVQPLQIKPGQLNEQGTFIPPVVSGIEVTPGSVVPAEFTPGGFEAGNVTPAAVSTGNVDSTPTASQAEMATQEPDRVCVVPFQQ